MSLTIPNKIGKYDVLSVLGEGGMGTVYKAVDPFIGRMVALKIITAAHAADPGLLDRFHREARANGNLQHPNIVVVYEFGDEGGSPYLAMEYLEGVSFDALIKQKRPLSLTEKLKLIIEICGGLQYAHERGVIHRDIKPANLMLLPSGIVKILDFGIARIQNEVNVTRTGQVVGTIPYMSPEQLSGGSVDGRTDVFSTGIVLYQLLTYNLPFCGENTGSTMRKIICDPPPPLSNYLPSYPAELDEVMAHVLAKSPEERYTSETLAAELVRVQEQLKREGTVQSDGWTIFNSAGVRRSQELGVMSAPGTQTAKPADAIPASRGTAVQPACAPGRLDTLTETSVVRGSSPPALEPGHHPPSATARAHWKWILLTVIVAVVLGVLVLWKLPNRPLRNLSSGREDLANSAARQSPEPALPQQVTTSTGMMRLVPGGEFLMGSDAGRRSGEFGYYNEAPAHSVNLPPFYIDQYEVTNAEYKKFCDATGRKYPELKGLLRDYFSHGDYPVINVSWDDARAYAAWAGKRLPTEAEWEKAARGTDGRRYPWGNELDSSVIPAQGQVAVAVGSHPADTSPYGVRDMAANVPEWTEDSYQLYTGNPAALPQQESSQKVVRGVLFGIQDKGAMGITNRASAEPVIPRGKISLIGFRCAADTEAALRIKR